MKHWNNITIEDYQFLYGIIIDENLTDFDKEVKLVAFINGLTEDEVDNLSIEKFKDLKETMSFLHDGKIEGKVQNIIKANGREYALSLDAFKITYGQYVDLTSFMSADGGLFGNLHSVMASIARPVKKTWYGVKVAEDYGSRDYNEVADDMLKANFSDCYNTCVFFCKLFKKSMKTFCTYFQTISVSPEMVQFYQETLKSISVGYTTSNVWQSLKV